jgi:hypothetical protein
MVLILPGSVLAGLLVYSILAYLYTPIQISIPLSILISTLVLGLNKYYFTPQKDREDERESREHTIGGNPSDHVKNLVFIWSYGILISILIATSISEQNNYTSYVSWERITFLDTVILADAIAFSFFLPGYGLVAVLDKNHTLTSPLRFLLSYLISILLVALPTYIGASLGYVLSNTEPFIILAYVSIFVLFLLRHLNTEGLDFFRLWAITPKESLARVRNLMTNRTSEFVVLASLFALVVFYTYYLNDGVMVVDQWFHHGRALLIGSEVYRDIAPEEFYKDPYTDVGSDITQIYPPIFSSMLAGFFELSNSASVNSYVSIGFLNAMPVFAFYYFFTAWVPKYLKRASLLAMVLFVLSSGFGWVYAIDLAFVSPPGNEAEPEMSSINILALTSDTTYDIGLPSTFINVGHPDITTPLIVIALPAGFTLLGMIKEFAIKKGEEDEREVQITESKIAASRQGPYSIILRRAMGTTMRALPLIMFVSFLGILSHDEFYLFIIIACVVIIVLLATPSVRQTSRDPTQSYRKNLVFDYYVFFPSFLTAMLSVALVDSFISPTKYYVTREIGGIPLIFLCFIFVSSAWIIYTAIQVAGKRWNFSFTASKKSEVSSKIDNTWLREISKAVIWKTSKIKNPLSIGGSSSAATSDSNDIRSGIGFSRIIRFVLPIATVSLVAFLYMFTFLVWSQLSVEDIKLQTDTENEWNIPWYLYPMKFGLTGLLGLAFLLSYLFKKFEKEVFIFLIVAIIAFVTGPYYDEHRLGKYIMAGMACLAALLIYQIISGARFRFAFTPSFFASRLKHPALLGSKFDNVAGGILLGLVITFSSLSIFMFASLVELITNIPEFNEDTRRDFPTYSELELLDFLSAKSSAQKPDYNIALPEKEVDNNRGFLTKLYGFTLLPRAKLLQTPLVLNASTMETFYNLLDYAGTKFIVVPKKDLTQSLINPNDNIIQFALENFPKAFQDDNYVVLEVPPFSPPTPKGDVALIYPKNELFSSTLVSESDNNNNNTNSTLTEIPFNRVWFNQIDNINDFVKGESERGTAVLYGDKEQRVVLWADVFRQQHPSPVNYIEAIFRIIGENKTSNDAGITWIIGDKEYTLSLRNDRLETLAKSTDGGNKGETLSNKLVNVKEIQRENKVWYTFKILVVDSVINIYLNDLLAAQVPVERSHISEQPDGNGNSFTNVNVDASMGSIVEYSKATPITNYNSSISKVGLFSYNNIAEFKPIKLGNVFPKSDKKEDTYYQHYYPLSMLALSKIAYNTYIEGDLSAFSKEYVIIPFDPPSRDSKLSSASSLGSDSANDSIYLDYVRNGGNLIVIDSANYSKQYAKERGTGMFSKLFSLSSTGNYAIFNGLSGTSSLQTTKSPTGKENPNDSKEREQAAKDLKIGNENMINISGVVEKILYSGTIYGKGNTASIKSYYTTENKDSNNNNRTTQGAIVAPFIIEKKYGNGTITYVNAHGYFHSIFSALSGVSNNSETPYPSSNANHYFYTLANITNLIHPELGREDGRFPKTLDNSVSDTGGAPRIRQIIDDIQISSGYVTRINSSSLLLSMSNNSNGNLAAKEVTFTASSPSIESSSLTVTDPSTKNNANNIDTNDWRHKDLASLLPQSNSETNPEPQSNKHGFKDAKIRNLKIYGSYEIIVESTSNSKPFFPVFPSFSDYVTISFPNSFDLTIRLSDSKPSYAEFEIIGDYGGSNANDNFQRLRIYGQNTTDNSTSVSEGLDPVKSNEIHFHKVQSDITSNGLTSLSMKSPQFQIKREMAGTGGMQNGPTESVPKENTILTFTKDSPETGPVEIINKIGNSNDSVIFRIDYVDNHNQLYREGIKKHYLSYIEEDIKANVTKVPNLQLPGDISERAKRQGVELQWQKTVTLDSSLLLAGLTIITSIIVTKIATKRKSWSKQKFPKS